MSDWIDYSERRPDSEGFYRWRVPSNAVEGAVITVIAEMRERGAGYTRVISPTFDYWDGYQVHVPAGLQWRPIPCQKAGKKYGYAELDVEGVENEPCPYCGRVPTWEASEESRYGGCIISASPQNLNSWRLKCCGFGGTPRYDDPRKLAELRNGKLATLRKYAAIARQIEDETHQIVPSYRGYAHLGVGAYLLEHSARGEPAELCICIATDEEKAGRTVGDLQLQEGEREIPAEKMAVRLRFENVAGLDALEQQLRLLREEHFAVAPQFQEEGK